VSYTTETFELKRVSGDENYLYPINLSSSDKYGSWKGDGYISLSKNGARFWMMKSYKDRKKAGQTGSWQYLIYDG